MLIEFSVKNHRAFREKQTFSMVPSAATARKYPERVADSGFKAVPFVLRQSCLFGHNGAGKSSLIDAMAFMRRFVRTSFRNEADDDIPVEPFLFHRDWSAKPSEFETLFIHDETLYQYGFAVTATQVEEEWLFARPKRTGRQRQLFSRVYDARKNAYDWEISSLHVKGERDSWKAQTRPNALFLSTAVQLNADALKGPYDWLTSCFCMLADLEIQRSGRIGGGYTATRFNEDGWKTRIIDFFKTSDIDLSDIRVEERELAEYSDIPEEIIDFLKQEHPSVKIPSVEFVRRAEGQQPKELPLREESTGTRNLFDLAGPVIDVLDKGYTLVVDEFNSALHPLAFQHLVGLFSDPDHNKHKAQVIFTTHDTSLLDSEYIGRDQVWLVEKGRDLAARLVPLSDFKLRQDTVGYQKRYLQGRVGGVPRVVV